MCKEVSLFIRGVLRVERLTTFDCCKTLKIETYFLFRNEEKTECSIQLDRGLYWKHLHSKLLSRTKVPEVVQKNITSTQNGQKILFCLSVDTVDGQDFCQNELRGHIKTTKAIRAITKKDGLFTVCFSAPRSTTL